MHRLLILLPALAAAACASRPSGGVPDDLQSLIRNGDRSIPVLKDAILDPAASAERRRQLAWALGEIWTQTGNGTALEAYIEAVQKAPDDSQRRALLTEAHRFRDNEGRVLALLDTALREMRVITPQLVVAAAAMTDVEALEMLMKVVGKGVDAPSTPEREVALRYIGRAARRGRREAVAFLSACAQSSDADLAEKAAAELKRVAGGDAPKGWRDWWFKNHAGERRAWLAESFPSVGGRPFDPGDRDHIGELVARIPRDADAEPELWYLEQALGRSFGYVSPRDVFDPDVDAGALSESNRRAIATAVEWWRENSPYLFLNPATGRFDISEEARRIGVPVDPKTGKPGR